MKRYFCEQISDIFYSPYSLLQGKLLVKQQNWDQALKFVNLNNVFLIFHWNENYNFLEKRILKWMGIMCGVCWIYQIPGAPQSFWIPAYPPQPVFKFNYIFLSFVYQYFFVIIPDGHNRFIFAVKAGCHFDAILGDKCSISLKVPSL